MALNFLVSNYPKLAYVFMAVLGACLGSFAAVIIYRWPQDISVVSPRSFCAACRTKLKPWHNIPIISWLFLRGRCAFCRMPYGSRSLLIEVIVMLALVGLYAKFGLSLALVEKFVFIFLLICLAYIDLDTFCLPLPLLVGLLAWGLLFCGIYNWYPQLYHPLGEPAGFLRVMVFKTLLGYSMGDRLWGGIVGLGAFSLINIIATHMLRFIKRLAPGQWAMGWGDPLLVMAIGLFVGLSHLVLVIFLASAAGSIMGIINKLWAVQDATDDDIAAGALPYGPFLALAAIYVYLF